MASQAEDGYILARTEAEYARLRAQARAWEGVTQRVLEGAGLPRPEGSEVAGLYAPIRVMGPMVRSVVASLADLDARIRALEQENRIQGLGPLMIGVWTTLPA